MRRLSALVLGLLASAAACATPAPPAPADDPAPATLDAFKAAAARVLEETRVPGAGIALVSTRGVEWAGGLGWADREARRPVDAETLFRVGSISKSFVALALVQLYEDGLLDLDAPVADLLPGLRMENPWQATHPVLVRHLLEHTAGFDDMHFNEIYVLDDAPDRPLEDVLLRNPASRRVRWRPGTRMAYSNPGYAVAGRVIEAVTNGPFDAFIRARIFDPLDMSASTFSGPVDDPRLAQGYDHADGPPVVRRRIHLRPAGALHTSPRDLARFVEMLLGWGERGDGYVVDPEYLSNMEWPRTTVASTAGVRAGYGLGIFSTIDLPFHALGHEGGIDGFLSAYGYSPSRDVGYVVLLNSTHAPEALRRLSSLALRYLKRDVEPVPKETMAGSPGDLHRFEGYYHDASPRNAVVEPFTFPVGGWSVDVRGGRLELTPALGATEPLVPVNEALFRRESELMASLAFTTVEGTPVMAGAGVYAERRARWPVLGLLALLAGALTVAACAPVVALGAAWRRYRTGGPSATGIGLGWLLALAALAAIAAAVVTTPVADLGAPTTGARALYASTLAYPAMTVLVAAWTMLVWRRRPGRAFTAFATLTAAAHLGLAGYLAYWGLVGFRSWTY